MNSQIDFSLIGKTEVRGREKNKTEKEKKKKICDLLTRGNLR